MEDATITTEEALARMTHEANRAYCLAHGDSSQPPWEQAPEWQRESARYGVRGILSGSIRTPSDSHASWLAHKIAEGWIYGPEKNIEKKTHPCLVPYERLPVVHRMKDVLFFDVVQAGLRVLENAGRE